MAPEQMARVLADILNDQPMAMKDIETIRRAEVQLMGEQVNLITSQGSFAITVRKFGGPRGNPSVATQSTDHGDPLRP